MKETQDVAHRDTEIVSQVRARLESELGAERFDVWFGEGVRFERQPTSLCIVADSTFRVHRLRKSLLNEIEVAVRGVMGAEILVDFRVEVPAVSPASTPSSESPVITVTPTISEPFSVQSAAGATVPLAEPRERRTGGRGWSAARLAHVQRGRSFAKLQDFQRGNCNQVAFSAAELVVRHPAQMNPLMIHGPSGTGKTHLLEGIWCEVRRRGGRRSIYLSAEQFTTYFLQALRGSGLPSFRQKYRAVDLLVVDDVQFFAGKQATISELLHTVDALLRENRQVVLAADRAPAELAALGPELQHRLGGGLVCPLQPLDRDTRQAVLRQLSERRQLVLSDELLDRVAERVPGDARQLAGWLNRLWATSAALGRAIDGVMVDDLLDELFPLSSQVIKLDDIQRVVCDEFGLDLATLRSGERTRRVSYPRMLAMWLARKHTRAALTEIGDYFGRKSHSTVVSAQNKVDEWVNDGQQIELSRQPCDVRVLVQRLEQNLRAS